MAHGFLQSFDSELKVFSAGTNPASQVNKNAVQVMKEAGIDISGHTPKHVDQYINDEWDYVITVCGGAKETCPVFLGKVKNQLHIGFDDPADAVGSDAFILSEYYRVRDEIRIRFLEFYNKLKQEKA